MGDHILHHSERGTERGVLKKTRHREQRRRRPPVRLQNGEQIGWQGDEAADRRNQRIPAHVALGERIGEESAGDDSQTHRNPSREPGDEADRRVVESKSAAEVRWYEGIEPIRGEPADGDAEHHVQHWAVDEQGLAHGTQFAQFAADRKRRQRGPHAHWLPDEHFDQNGDRDPRQPDHRAGGSPSPMLRHIASRHGGQKVSQRNPDGVDG